MLVVIVALIVVAAAATLGLVKAGVIDKSSSGPTHPTGTAQHHHATKTSVPLVTQVSTGNAAATYRVDIAAYTVTVVTTTGRSWVTIGAAGQHPAYQGVLEPDSSQKELLLGPLPGEHRGRRHQGHRVLGGADLHADAAGSTLQLLRS